MRIDRFFVFVACAVCAFAVRACVCVRACLLLLLLLLLWCVVGSRWL